MQQEPLAQLRNYKSFRLVCFIFIALSLWWISIFARGLTEGHENNAFTVIYPILSLLGGISGWYFSKKWGGLKSVLGRAILMLSMGLLAQFIGQLLYIYYIFILGIEIPYPSAGDVSYFASVFFYIIGAYELAKVSGYKLTLKTVSGKVKAIGIPIIILLLSYLVLLQDYDFSSATPILLLFDFGWPIGQVIYVSIALTALFISRDILGGMMRRPIMLLIFALIFQYAADFVFSYQFNQDTLYYAGFTDYLYCISYFLMAIALFSIGNMFYKVQES